MTSGTARQFNPAFLERKKMIAVFPKNRSGTGRGNLKYVLTVALV